MPCVRKWTVTIADIEKPDEVPPHAAMAVEQFADEDAPLSAYRIYTDRDWRNRWED